MKTAIIILSFAFLILGVIAGHLHHEAKLKAVEVVNSEVGE